MTIFEDFVKTELPVRPVVQTDNDAETILVRKGVIPRAYEPVSLLEGEVLGKEGGVIKGVTVAGGPVSDHRVIELNSGEDLGGQRIITSKSGDAFYSDPSVEIDGGKVVGLTTTATNLNDPCFIQTSGLMEDVTWTWTEGPVYNGANGVLTQTAPLTGFVLQVGIALTGTTILINIQQSIIRG
jgi:hypothetical protein